MVSVAYLRLLGHTQQEAAKGAGVSVRTIQYWEAREDWSEAQSEARARWLQGCDALAMRALRNGLLGDDQATARWWAGKRIKELGGSNGTRPPGGLGEHGRRFGVVLTPETLQGMTDEQLDALEAALAIAGGAAGPEDSDHADQG